MVQARARAQWKKLGTYQLIGHSQSMPAPSMHLKGQSKLPIRTYVRSIDAVHAVPAAARAIRHRSTVTYVLLAGVLHHALLLHVRLARIYSGTFSRSILLGHFSHREIVITILQSTPRDRGEMTTDSVS